MKGSKKRNKWVTAIAVIFSVVALYLAFDIGRGTIQRFSLTKGYPI